MDTHRPRLILKKREDRRLRAGHLWVFSNEVDTERSPLTQFTAGQLVIPTTSNGHVLGLAYVNPGTLIAARLFSTKTDDDLGTLVDQRLREAYGWRQQSVSGNSYRLVFGESDGLPGLVIDRYGEDFVLQITTAGMQQLQSQIVDRLIEFFSPRSILLRNDSPYRALEGLDRYVETAHGKVPEVVEIEENGARFQVRLADSQKTGWYFDHRDNRTNMQTLVADKTVLDLHSYLGAWGITAALAGAREVHCVDSAADSGERIRANAALNNVTVSTTQGDATQCLRDFREAGKKFDVVILDPPAFIKRRKDQKAGTRAYHSLNQAALRVLADPGVLITASCSSHLTGEALRDAVRQAALANRQQLRLVAQGLQAKDHPIHPAMPETEYLKCLFYYVTSKTY